MGNHAQVIVTTGSDQTSVPLVCTFQDGDDAYGSAARFCSSVMQVAGVSPSYGFIGIPIDSIDSDKWGNTVALKLAMARKLLLNTRAKIDYKEGNSTYTLLTGSLQELAHNFSPNEDSIVGIIVDDKLSISKIKCFGRMVWDPSTAENGSKGNYYYDSSSKLIFNRMGYDDCLDHPDYGPVFAPSFRWGWKVNGSQEDSYAPSRGSATTRARAWTVEDALTYLMNQYGAKARRASSQVDYGTVQLPNTIQWDKAANHFAGSDRTLKDTNVDDVNLLDALQAIARRGGAFDLTVLPIQNTYNSKIGFVNTNPPSNTGSRFFMPDYGGSTIQDCMNGSDIVQSGYVKESIVKYFYDVCICGDAVAVERFLTTEGNTLGSINGLPTLEPAWSTENEKLFKNYCDRYKGTVEAFNAACNIWPDVYTAYRVGRGAPIFIDTKWGKTSLGARYPRFKPHQLSAFNNGDVNPRNWQPREIIVEYKLNHWEFDALTTEQKAFGPWRPAYKYDNLTLSPDSTILYLSALRDKVQTWYSNDDPDKTGDGSEEHPSGTHGNEDCSSDPSKPWQSTGIYTGKCMVRREVRLNMAIESDWCITGRNKSDPNNTASRINPNGPKFTYLAVSQPMDYVEYLRSNSRPNGDAYVNEPYKSQNFPDKKSEGNELFTDRTNETTGREPKHALDRISDVKRIDHSGELIIHRLNPSVYVGLPVTLEGNSTIPMFGVVKSVLWDNSESGITKIGFGNPDSVQIYDSPAAYTGNSNPIGSGAIEGTKNTDDYVYEEHTTTTTKKEEKYNNKKGDDYDDGTNSNGAKGNGNNNESSSSSTSTTTSKTSTDRRKATPMEHLQNQADRAQEALDSAKASGDFKAQHAAEKDKRLADKALENRKNFNADKAAQRSNKGSGIGDIMNAFGKPNSGSINGKDSGQIQFGETLLGKNSSGSMNDKTELNSAANGLADTSKADQYDRENYKSTPRDFDAFDAIAKAFGRQAQKQNIKPADKLKPKPLQTPKDKAKDNKPVPEVGAGDFRIEPSKPKAIEPKKKVKEPDDE